MLATALVPAAAGCGGEDEPTAAETRAAKARWAERVDAACRKANEAIADRGWPVDLVDVDRLVVRGITDVRAATKTIVALRIPKGAGPAPGRFVRELKALEPQLAALSDASEELEPAPLVKAAVALKPRLSDLEARAREAGLRHCVTHDERHFVPDAVRGPVFAEQLAKLDRSLLRRIKRIDLPEADTPGELARMFKRYSEIIDTAIAGIDSLDPPQWAATQTSAYQGALLELQSASQKMETLLEQDRSTITRPKYLRVWRNLRRAGRAEMKARRKMIRAVGAAPTTAPGAEPEEEAPEGEQIS